MAKIRVLIADDDPAVRSALADLIGTEEGFELVGAASSASEAVTLARDHLPAVALLDVKMPGGGSSAALQVRAISPRTQVVALSAYEDRETILQMVRAGAEGYLVKGTSGAEIVGTIRRAAAGLGTLSPQVTATVLRELATQLATSARVEEERARQAARVRQMLESGAIRIAYQPVVALDTLEVTGMEALARFPQEPARDPSVWFAEADLVGLQLDLELAAVRAAFHGGPPPNGHYLAVNVSPATATSERFHELIRDAPPAAVVIEVTEHAPIDDYEAFRRDLETIRRRGVRLAVDDAGAGFASLNHIVQLSPDFIKLDISLTRRVHRDRNRRALARALISFASEIGATILAEGIEQQEELEALKEIGVAYGQGFYLGRPARPT